MFDAPPPLQDIPVMFDRIYLLCLAHRRHSVGDWLACVVIPLFESGIVLGLVHSIPTSALFCLTVQTGDKYFHEAQ